MFTDRVIVNWERIKTYGTLQMTLVVVHKKRIEERSNSFQNYSYRYYYYTLHTAYTGLSRKGGADLRVCVPRSQPRYRGIQGPEGKTLVYLSA